jgi:4-amino-4-deoxy-L-arabinose transferase-like glycosyltransferase
VIALTAVAALVRFASLDAQSFWYDEALTHELVNDSFGGMLDGVLGHEAQPPPYFVLAWFWIRIFGDGEIGLRSLSALLGTLTVPLAYEAARLVGGRRVALAAGLLTALSPALVWYSQEARAYALVTFLSTLALLFFLRAVQDGWAGRDLAVWAAASVLAVASHYFALFAVLPMAAWVLLRGPGLRRVLPSLGGLALGMLAIAPMLLYQQSHGGVDWIGEIPLWPRVRDAVFFFAAGPSGFGSLTYRREEVFAVAIACFVLALAAALVWSEGPVRRRLLLVLGVAAGVILAPLAGAAVDTDYVLDRNFLPAWVPLTIAAAVGLCVRRLRWVGPAVVAIVAAGFAVIVVGAVPRNPERQRDDWRSVAERIGPPREDRVMVVSPFWHTRSLRIYQPRTAPMRRPAPVTKVWTVELETFVPHGSLVTTIAPGPPFAETRYERIQNFTVREYTAPQPVVIDPKALEGEGTNRGAPFFQPRG